MVKDKSPEEIRRTFKIRNEFTPEEEVSYPLQCGTTTELRSEQEQIRKESEWSEEI